MGYLHAVRHSFLKLKSPLFLSTELGPLQSIHNS